MTHPAIIASEATINDARALVETVLSELPDRLETTPQVEKVNGLMVKVSGAIKQLDTARKAATVPLDQQKKEIKAAFDAPIDLLDQVKTKVKGLLKAYADEQESILRKAREEAARKQAEEAERIKKEAEAKASEGGIAAQIAAEKMLEQAERVESRPMTAFVAPKIDKRYLKKSYYAEIVDIALLPSEFFIPDQDRLNALARDRDGKNPPPGVVFKEKR